VNTIINHELVITVEPPPVENPLQAHFGPIKQTLLSTWITVVTIIRNRIKIAIQWKKDSLPVRVVSPCGTIPVSSSPTSSRASTLTEPLLKPLANVSLSSSSGCGECGRPAAWLKDLTLALS